MTELTCFKAYNIRGEIGVNIDDDTSETSPTFIPAALMARSSQSIIVTNSNKRNSANK